MGWASGDKVFDPVANALIRTDVNPDTLYEVCRILIEQLQERGWDTEGESLGEFLDYPEIVAAFAINGIEVGGPDGGPDEDVPLDTIYAFGPIENPEGCC